MLLTGGQINLVAGTGSLLDPVTVHLLLIGGGLVIAAASLEWTLQNRDKHAATEFGLFLGTVVLWAAAQLVEVIGGPQIAYGASFTIEAIRGLIAVSWFYFTMTYAGYSSAIHSTTVRVCAAAGTIYILFFTGVPPLATAVMFDNVQVTHVPFTTVAFRGVTPLYHLSQLIGYLLVGIGTIALIHQFVKTEYTRAWQTVVFTATFFALVAFDIFNEVMAPVAGIDYSVIGTSMMSVIFILALYRGDLFGFAPVARDHVFHNIDDGVVVLNPDHTIIDVNPTAVSMLGNKVQIGSDAKAVLPDEIATDNRFANLTDGRTTLTVAEEGTTRHYDMTVSALSSTTEETGFAIILRDITERTERTQELQETRERMEFALTAIDAAVWDWNVDADQSSYYPSEEPLYGTTVETLDDFMDVVRPDDQQQVRETLEYSLETGESKHEEFRVLRDGDVRWIEASGKPVSDDGATHIIGVVRDITDRKESERELKRQNERLDRFASVVSHDLRNPLNVASGRLELAQQECDSEHLDDVAGAHGRMETLIDDVLTLARQGESVDEPEPVALANTINRCWQTIETVNARLVVETEQTIQADPDRLKQLLENLFRNAIDHADDDVSVTVGGLDDSNGFYIADDGPGISPGERDEVFDAGYSTADEGTGLGLNIVQEIAETHEWDIRVIDGEAGGARFEISGVEIADE